MIKNLIFVHGINNQDNTREEIERLWLDALKAASGKDEAWWSNINVHTAYYADILYEAEQTWDSVKNTATAMSISSPDDDFAPDEVAELYLTLQRKWSITDDQVRTYLDEEDQNQDPVRMGKGIHKRWLIGIARALEDLVPGLAPGVARAFLPQAAAYLQKPGLYDQINNLVNQQVFEPIKDDLPNTVIVSHSLGTIVSYVLLRQMFSSEKSPLFITLGSPLGIEIVKDRINSPYITPPTVEEWINGSDREDFVALHPELNSDTFGPANLINISDLDNGYDNPHSITKYLGQIPINSAIISELGN